MPKYKILVYGFSSSPSLNFQTRADTVEEAELKGNEMARRSMRQPVRKVVVLRLIPDRREVVAPDLSDLRTYLKRWTGIKALAMLNPQARLADGGTAGEARKDFLRQLDDRINRRARPVAAPAQFVCLSEHDYADTYYGYLCNRCGHFIAYGCAPWEAGYSGEPADIYALDDEVEF